MDIQAYIESGIVESYVLGLASAEEAAEIENLQRQYPEIQLSVTNFSASIEEFATANAITPPAFIKDNVMTAFGAEKKRASVVPLSTASLSVNGTVRKLRMISVLAAASVILFIVSAGLNFYLYKKYSRKNEDYLALLSQRNSLLVNNQVYQTQLHHWRSAAEMFADPAMAVIKMKGTPGKEGKLATVLWDTRNKDVYVMPNKLPDPGQGKQYQLWALVDGKPVDAGMLEADCQGVCKMKNIPTAQAFAITLENKGGSPTPNMQQLFVLGKV